MDPPAPGVYSTIDELLVHANEHAHTHGYKLVVVRSKTNVLGKKTWVHLACDRHGTKRNTHGLTDETRKKNRRSRRCECPMNCIANKTPSGLWELVVRNGQHNHPPNEPPKKKKSDLPPLHSSEIVNLPLLRTPSACSVYFCLTPMGTSSDDSEEIAEVTRLLKRSGLQHTVHSSGMNLEGPWDDVMRIIGQAHSLLHGNGNDRIQTTICVGSRLDKRAEPLRVSPMPAPDQVQQPQQGQQGQQQVQQQPQPPPQQPQPRQQQQQQQPPPQQQQQPQQQPPPPQQAPWIPDFGNMGFLKPIPSWRDQDVPTLLTGEVIPRGGNARRN